MRIGDKLQNIRTGTIVTITAITSVVSWLKPVKVISLSNGSRWMEGQIKANYILYKEKSIGKDVVGPHQEPSAQDR